jgi:hypothetical protein
LQANQIAELDDKKVEAIYSGKVTKQEQPSAGKREVFITKPSQSTPKLDAYNELEGMNRLNAMYSRT